MSSAADNSASEQPVFGPPRVAFFGGSFDPPHLGHLGIAHAAQRALSLDTVLFAPVGRQPLKTNLPTAAPFAQRVAMTELAIADEPHFALSLIDAPAQNGHPNYTADTLERLRSTLPAGAELFLLIGADSLAQFPRWHRAAEIPFLATVVVASRPGESALDHPERWLPATLHRTDSTPTSLASTASSLRRLAIADHRGRSAHVLFLDEPDYLVSATELRGLLALPSTPDSNLPLLPPGVLAYIRAHGIYENRAQRSK